VFIFAKLSKRFAYPAFIFIGLILSEEIKSPYEAKFFLVISIGFIINQIAKNLCSDAIYLNIGVWRGFSMFAGMINTKCKVYGIDNFSHDYADANPSLSNYEESKKTKEYFLKKFPLGSSFLIALNAVGAVKSDFTLCSEIILQNTPASGVPTGFPSNNTVVHP